VKAGVTTLVQDELAYHIFIQATAHDVWDALTGSGGWGWVLSDLKTLLETGRPLTY
jgi:hypothetical protein